MGANKLAVFTIGHSNHKPKRFVSLLRRYAVSTVVDVRSAPYSRYLPHFNKENLVEILKESGIRYVFGGRVLGGQPEKRRLYDSNGNVQYKELAGTTAYKKGIESIVDRASQGHMALMCSEKEPLECHRTLLIGQTLAKRGVAVAHIHADGGVESHEDAMDRLLDSFKLPHNGDLFRSRAEVIADAVARQAQRVGARWRDLPAGGVERERAR